LGGFSWAGFSPPISTAGFSPLPQAKKDAKNTPVSKIKRIFAAEGGLLTFLLSL